MQLSWGPRVISSRVVTKRFCYLGSSDTEVPSGYVEKRREVVLRCLIENIWEGKENLISVHHSHDETEVYAELGSSPLKIYMRHQPNTIGIITVEGQPMVRGVPNL